MASAEKRCTVRVVFRSALYDKRCIDSTIIKLSTQHYHGSVSMTEWPLCGERPLGRWLRIYSYLPSIQLTTLRARIYFETLISKILQRGNSSKFYAPLARGTAIRRLSVSIRAKGLNGRVCPVEDIRGLETNFVFVGRYYNLTKHFNSSGEGSNTRGCREVRVLGAVYEGGERRKIECSRAVLKDRRRNEQQNSRT